MASLLCTVRVSMLPRPRRPASRLDSTLAAAWRPSIPWEEVLQGNEPAAAAASPGVHAPTRILQPALQPVCEAEDPFTSSPVGELYVIPVDVPANTDQLGHWSQLDHPAGLAPSAASHQVPTLSSPGTDTTTTTTSSSSSTHTTTWAISSPTALDNLDWTFSTPEPADQGPGSHKQPTTVPPHHPLDAGSTNSIPTAAQSHTAELPPSGRLPMCWVSRPPAAYPVPHTSSTLEQHHRTHQQQHDTHQHPTRSSTSTTGNSHTSITTGEPAASVAATAGVNGSGWGAAGAVGGGSYLPGRSSALATLWEQQPKLVLQAAAKGAQPRVQYRWKVEQGNLVKLTGDSFFPLVKLGPGNSAGAAAGNELHDMDSTADQHPLHEPGESGGQQLQLGMQPPLAGFAPSSSTATIQSTKPAADSDLQELLDVLDPQFAAALGQPVSQPQHQQQPSGQQQQQQQLFDVPGVGPSSSQASQGLTDNFAVLQGQLQAAPVTQRQAGAGTGPAGPPSAAAASSHVDAGNAARPGRPAEQLAAAALDRDLQWRQQQPAGSAGAWHSTAAVADGIASAGAGAQQGVQALPPHPADSTIDNSSSRSMQAVLVAQPSALSNSVQALGLVPDALGGSEVPADPTYGLTLSVFVYSVGAQQLRRLLWSLGLPAGCVAFVSRVADADVVLHQRAPRGVRQYQYDMYRKQAKDKGIPFISLTIVDEQELQRWFLPVFALYAGRTSPAALAYERSPNSWKRRRSSNVKL